MMVRKTFSLLFSLVFVFSNVFPTGATLAAAVALLASPAFAEEETDPITELVKDLDWRRLVSFPSCLRAWPPVSG